MPRRSLRPELNQIRGWVRQGRTDAWIAHQLEVTVQQIQAFKREQGLEPDVETEGRRHRLRRRDRSPRRGRRPDRRRARRRRGQRAEEEDEDDERRGALQPRSRRARRAAARRRSRKKPTPLEATFDHGEEGYGLWLDPAVQDDPIYAEYWAGHRPVEVAIEEDQIVIRRAGGDETDDSD